MRYSKLTWYAQIALITSNFSLLDFWMTRSVDSKKVVKLIEMEKFSYQFYIVIW